MVSETYKSGRVAIFLIVTVGVCGQSLIFTALPPVLPMIARHFSDGKQGEFIAQMMMAVPSAGFFLGGLFAGSIVDRIELRTILLSSLLAFAIAGVIPLFAQSGAVLLLSRFAIGLANAALSVACTAFLLRRFDGVEDQRRALSWQGMAAAGVAFASLFAGGLLGDLGGWRAPFLLYPLMVVPAVIAIARLSFPARPAVIARSPSTEPRGTIVLWLLLLMLVPLNSIVITGSVQLPFLLNAKGIGDPMDQALVLGGGQTTQFLGAILFPPVLARFGSRGALQASLLCLAIGLLGAVVAEGVIASLVAKAIFNLANGILLPLYSYLIITQASELGRNRALGWMTSAIFVGILLNPPLVALLGAMLSLQAIYVLLSGVLIAALAFSMLPLPAIVARHTRGGARSDARQSHLFKDRSAP